MVEVPGAQAIGKLYRLAGSLDIDLLLDPLFGIEIINGSQMEKVIDTATELRQLLGRYAQ